MLVLDTRDVYITMKSSFHFFDEPFSVVGEERSRVITE
jgi:hypothetical protein